MAVLAHLHAIKHTIETSKEVVIKEKGRHTQEEAFVLIKNGVYLGYGFIKSSEQVTSKDALEHYLIPQKDHVDVWKVLKKKLAQL